MTNHDNHTDLVPIAVSRGMETAGLIAGAAIAAGPNVNCPDCGVTLIRLGGCFSCPVCGFGSCG
ncbi:hypothetical protein TRIP_C60394 [Candidatus Zixiibacteriota bacterium]|nr:hypothetical protein TRIP_C60394 [candidate division Zixibacteria bacterium]